MTREAIDLDRALLGDAYTSTEAMEVLATLCDEFGSRFGGTPGERLAAEYMRDRLTEYGLENARLEPFEYEGWRRGSASLKVVDPIELDIACITLPLSPPADLTVELFDADDGAVSTFERRGAEMAGKVVMASSEVYPGGSRRWIHRSEKYGRSALAGAAAFIFMNHYPAYGPATGGVGVDDTAGPIPAFGVAYEDGALLRRLLERHGHLRLELKSDDVVEPMTSWNVVADLPGTGDTDSWIMLGSHYDGHDISQGAQDPASGVASVLETARLLARHAPDLGLGVRFALWGVEEIGLYGSHAYARAHVDELANLRFYLNMDSAGAVKNKGIVLHEWPSLRSLFERWRDEVAFPFDIGQEFHTFSDHLPFLLRGVATGGIESVPKSRGGRGYGHTRYDTLDKVSLRELQDASALASLMAVRLASQGKWPARQRSQAELDEIFARPDYVEERAFETQMAAYMARWRG
jgi:hypothetical protein